MGSHQWRRRGSIIVNGLKLSGWEHAEFPVEVLVIEPVDIVERGVLHVIQALPGARMADQLGLVEAVERLG